MTNGGHVVSDVLGTIREHPSCHLAVDIYDAHLVPQVPKQNVGRLRDKVLRLVSTVQLFFRNYDRMPQHDLPNA